MSLCVVTHSTGGGIVLHTTTSTDYSKNITHQSIDRTKKRKIYIFLVCRHSAVQSDSSTWNKANKQLNRLLTRKWRTCLNHLNREKYKTTVVSTELQCLKTKTKNVHYTRYTQIYVYSTIIISITLIRNPIIVLS